MTHGSNCQMTEVKTSWSNVRCETEAEKCINFTSVSRHICHSICLQRKDCSLANYNFVWNYCLTTNNNCVRLIADSEFEIKYFGAQGSHCLYWVPSDTLQLARAVYHDEDQVVGRHMKSPAMLPGKLYVTREDFYTVFNGNGLHATTGKEALQVNPECHVTWINYIAGDPIPDGAVVGGYLSADEDSRRNDLYVIKAPTFDGHIEFGYYDPTAGRGFVEQSGANIYTEMDMLIFLWNVPPDVLRGYSVHGYHHWWLPRRD